MIISAQLGAKGNRYRCFACGIEAVGDAPVLTLCRKLLAAGHDPATPMEVYRGEVLALRVRSIGEGAKLRVDEQDGTRFGRYQPPARERGA